MSSKKNKSKSIKKLTIRFQHMDELFEDINKAIATEENLLDSPHCITFDSIHSYRSFMSSNRLYILSAISKLRPSSVYELAQLLKRRPQHVLADCRSLESHGFIKLEKEISRRRSLRPELSFDYDVIMVEDKSAMPLPVSEKSQQLLAAAAF